VEAPGPESIPQYRVIKLTAPFHQEYGKWADGQVLKLDSDLVERMRQDGAQFRPATEQEMRFAAISP
jgi:hypothetical protein